MHETRRSKRQPFEYVGLLDYGDGEVPRPCQVRDISPGGARITVFTDTSAIPETVHLLLSASSNVQRTCRVAWRSPSEIGVQFLKPTG